MQDTELIAPHFLIFHDEGAEVYLNGKQALDLPHSTQFYRWIPMDEAAAKSLRKRGNVIAVHASNRHHPQYIDVDMVDVLPATRAAGSAPDAEGGPSRQPDRMRGVAGLLAAPRSR